MPVLPQRSSARLKGIKLDPEKNVESGSIPDTTSLVTSKVERKARHEELNLRDMMGDTFEEGTMQDVRSTLFTGDAAANFSECSSKTELELLLQSMKLQRYSRVCQKRIYCMLFHPTQEKDLIFTGDQEGMVGVWDALASSSNEQEEPTSTSSGTSYSLQVHGRCPIACLRMDPVNQQKLYSASYDGTVRELDLAKCLSTEVWASPTDISLGEFDILTPLSYAAQATTIPSPLLCETNLWLSDHRGGLIHVDKRSNVSSRWQVSEAKIGGMSVNPDAYYCIATASNDRHIRLFDTRMLKSLPVVDHPPSKFTHDEVNHLSSVYEKIQLDSFGRKMACTAVDFSPDGRYLAGVSYDDSISLWHMDLSLQSKVTKSSSSTVRKRSSKLDSWLKLATHTGLLSNPNILQHNNQTGRWVTLFRACWNKNAILEPHFSIGNMSRAAEIYDCNGRCLVQLYDPDWITAVQAVTAMHPITPARMATGNGSGRCAFWAPTH